MSEDNTKTVHETREDIWWITDEYLTLGARMIARQFIDDEKNNYTDMEAFKKRVVYVMRQHCPVMYSYFFTEAGLETLPQGAYDIILQIIRAERPLFLGGGALDGKGRIITPRQ